MKKRVKKRAKRTQSKRVKRVKKARRQETGVPRAAPIKIKPIKFRPYTRRAYKPSETDANVFCDCKYLAESSGNDVKGEDCECFREEIYKTPKSGVDIIRTPIAKKVPVAIMRER